MRPHTVYNALGLWCVTRRGWRSGSAATAPARLLALVPGQQLAWGERVGGALVDQLEDVTAVVAAMLTNGRGLTVWRMLARRPSRDQRVVVVG